MPHFHGDQHMLCVLDRAGHASLALVFASVHNLALLGRHSLERLLFWLFVGPHSGAAAAEVEMDLAHRKRKCSLAVPPAGGTGVL